MKPLSPDAPLQLSEREGVFVAGRGVKLHYRTHRVQDAPFRAVVAVIESPEDRGRLYAELVRLLTPSGYAVYGCAHQENRRVPGQSGFLEEWSDLNLELDAFIGLVGAHEPDAPVFLAGGRIAGQLVMTYALHHPQKLHGVIAYQPRLHQSTTRLSLVSLAKALTRIWPAFTPADTVDPALAPDATMPEPLSPPPRGGRPSPQAAVTEATVSEIAIPALIVDEESPGTRLESHGDSPDAYLRRPSLHDVEPWLSRVLTGSTA